MLFIGFYRFQKSFQYRAKVQDHQKNKTRTGTEPISEKKNFFVSREAQELLQTF